MILFDAHFHADGIYPSFEGAARCLPSVYEGENFCCPGICCSAFERDWPQVLAASSGNSKNSIIPCLGIHPWHAYEISDEVFERLRGKLIELKKDCFHSGAFIGEAGLDFSPVIFNAAMEFGKTKKGQTKNKKEIGSSAYGRQTSREEIKKQQERVFAAQLALSAELGIAAVIHCVRAWGKMLEMIKKYRPPAFMIHAYKGSPEMTKEFAALNGYFSFGPGLACPHEIKSRAALLSAPHDRILLESEGGNIGDALNAAADILKIPQEKTAETANRNAAEFLSASGIKNCPGLFEMLCP